MDQAYKEGHQAYRRGIKFYNSPAYGQRFLEAWQVGWNAACREDPEEFRRLAEIEEYLKKGECPPGYLYP